MFTKDMRTFENNLQIYARASWKELINQKN